MRFRLWLLVFGASGIASTARGQKDLAGCKTVLDAMMKSMGTAHHLYSTETAKNRVSESILVNGKAYFEYEGHWRQSPLSPADMLKQEKENIDQATAYTCHATKDETVGGQATTVYRVHSENESSKADADVWVAKSTGLVMRTEEDIDLGGDATDKTHYSMKYDYSNVKAPPGVAMQ
jgi:hypothetical protein